MGGCNCCRRNYLNGPLLPSSENKIEIEISNPTTTISGEQPVIERVTENHMKSVQDLMQKMHANIKLINRLQKWIRGLISRKMAIKKPGLKPITIIKYVGQMLKASQENVRKVEEKLGPYLIDWNISEMKGKCELRKPVKDESEIVYQGYWDIQTNKKCGYGQQLYPNGAKYEGLFANNEMEGEGRFIYDTGDYYIGNRKAGQASGNGVFIGVDGTQYSGEWANNLHHGCGKEKWRDGSSFEGWYINGKKNGIGRFNWSDGSTYEGELCDDQLSGQG